MFGTDYGWDLGGRKVVGVSVFWGVVMGVSVILGRDDGRVSSLGRGDGRVGLVEGVVMGVSVGLCVVPIHLTGCDRTDGKW